MVRIVEFFLRWYVVVACAAATLGGIHLVLVASGLYDFEHPHCNSEYAKIVTPTWDYLYSLLGNQKQMLFLYDPILCESSFQLTWLMQLKLFVDYFPQYVVMPALVVGFGGWTLDTIYHRLRGEFSRNRILKRAKPHADELIKCLEP